MPGKWFCKWPKNRCKTLFIHSHHYGFSCFLRDYESNHCYVENYILLSTIQPEKSCLVSNQNIAASDCLHVREIQTKRFLINQNGKWSGRFIFYDLRKHRRCQWNTLHYSTTWWPCKWRSLWKCWCPFSEVYLVFFQDRRSSQDDDDDHDGEGIETGELREQDRFLPIANVARIMKKAIPAQVSCSQRFKISSKPKNFSWKWNIDLDSRALFFW